MSQPVRSVAPDPLARFVAIAGAENVLTGAEDRAYYAQDLYRAGAVPLAVLRPRSTEMLAALVAAATGAGLAVFPRGGGMSYTDAYLPTTAQAVVIDTAAMDRVLEIDAANRIVTVEAGCSWAKLDLALAPTGLRPPFWGPFSGAVATVGGSISQGSLTFGSGIHGTSSASLLSLTVVAADGRLVRTGADGQPGHPPVTRDYGPDLTGLFACDSGALGIKATVTLRLIPRPAAVGGLSFAYPDFAAMAAALDRVAAAGLASEVMAMEAETLAGFVSGSGSWGADAKALGAVLRAAGPRQALRMALAGRRFARDARYSAHWAVEGHDRRDLSHRMRRTRALAAAGGREIANTVPVMARAMPFPPPAVLHPQGRRMLPMHGILAPSRAVAFHEAFRALLAAERPRLEALGVTVPTMFTTVGTAGLLLYEPVFYWDDSLTPFHRRHTPPEQLARIGEPAEGKDARALVAELQRRTIDLMDAHGAAHMQIGRVYPYTRHRDAGALSLLKAIKSEMDPHGLINPGALGLA